MARAVDVEAEAPPLGPDQVAGAPHPREAAALHGQRAAEAAFLDAWASGRLHHAWLLRGPRGVGKATAAYRMARALLVHDSAPAALEVDPRHPVARRVAAGAESRLRTIRRAWNGKTGVWRGEITVEPVRDLANLFHLKAVDGGRRVAVIDPADEMNASAANALLKMLEEPPADAFLFLVSHAPGRLLPTIRSRCRTLDFAPLEADDLARALGEAGARSADAAALAELSAGSPGDALRLLAEDAPALYAGLVRLLAGAPGLDRRDLVALAQGCGGKAALSRYETVLALTVTLLRRLARAGAGLSPPAEAAPGEAALAARLAPDLAAARLWAEMSEQAEALGARARAVNLDPAQTVLDIWLRIDAAAARAARR